MTNNIVEANIYNYKDLRDAIQNLRQMIIKGQPTTSDSDRTIFLTKLNSLFPDTTDTYATKLTTGSHGTTSAPTITDFKNLLHNSLYPYLNQTQHTGTDRTTIKNDHINTIGASTKDHLCFFKFNADTFTNILPDPYAIDNILYSIFIMEIFIKIVEALKDCYKNDSEIFKSSYAKTTKIFIVEKKLKQHHDINTPRGIFIYNLSSGSHSTPANGIYLYIGDLTKIFNSANITTVKNTYSGNASDVVNKGSTVPDNPVYTFDESNKLSHSNADNSEYYFNYLKIYEAVQTQETIVTLGNGSTAPYELPAKHNYKFNIERVFNFITVIKYINKDSFLTTINYLHIYLLNPRYYRL
jgi:hypothetical protein